MPAGTAKASSALIVATPSDREIVLTRVFHAPSHLVFEAMTKPEHLLHWFGPHSCPLVECKVDLRVGGAWRYILRGPDGKDMGMRGVYQEITPYDRLISTESFDDYPGESLNTVTLTEEAGKTTLTNRVLYESKETRDAVIRSGMERGAGETYDRLAEHLHTIAATQSPEHELVITRVFDAPRELVFECWTQPDHLQHWQGAPRGFTVTASESDIRPGGYFRICMRSPEGVDSWLQGGYREIVRPERLVFTHSWLDSARKPAGKPTLMTVTLLERDGKTELTLRQTGFAAVESRDGHKYGWNSALDVLADYLAESGSEAARAIVVSRLFDAPRTLVFDAFTDSRHVGNWWGPRGFTITTQAMDVRVGGVWRFVMHGPDGVDYPNKITYLEIMKPERLVYDHGDAGAQGYFQTTVTFAEEGLKTRLTMRLLFQSIEERETVVKKYNAIEGANQTLERLGEQLEKMQELLTTRVFDAPREVVFKAWTEVERLKRWWGPKGFTNPVCEVDVRPGGAIRIHMRGPDGNVYPMTGVFQEVVPPERLVFVTSALDQKGEPLFEVLNTVTFDDQGGKTKLTLHATVSKVKPEAAQHLAGMELGWSMALDRLADRLAEEVEA
jgi:uncharacterized protein YndB with AHSA1/START domain